MNKPFQVGQACPLVVESSQDDKAVQGQASAGTLDAPVHERFAGKEQDEHVEHARTAQIDPHDIEEWEAYEQKPTADFRRRNQRNRENAKRA